MGFWNDEGFLIHSPHTVVIDREGRLAVNLDGNQFTAEQLADLVETVLKRPSQSSDATTSSCDRPRRPADAGMITRTRAIAFPGCQFGAVGDASVAEELGGAKAIFLTRMLELSARYRLPALSKVSPSAW